MGKQILPRQQALIAAGAALLLSAGACELSQEQMSSYIDPALLKSVLTVSGNDGEYTSVTIEIVGVSLKRAAPAEGEDAFVELPLDPFVVDLAAMDATYEVLSRVMLPEGSFKEIRLITGDSGSVTRTDGSVGELKIPSGAQTGIKIKCKETIEASSALYTVVILDIDLDRSLVEKGNGDFNFKPVLHCDGTMPIALPPPTTTPGEGGGEGEGGEGGTASGGETSTGGEGGETSTGSEEGALGGDFLESCELDGSCFTPILGV